MRSSRFYSFLLSSFVFLSAASAVFSQTGYQPNAFTANQPQNYLANSGVFKQEIARLEINVVREGNAPMPIAQVPRLQKDDVLRVRLLDEAVNGLKPDQSNFDWTLLIAYVNPGRNIDKASSVSEEIRFKKSGWYKEYSFVVPYDSQPIFFLYPKPNYRSKILNLINNKQEEIRKIGEKTIEIADAYTKIGSFLNELQIVINRNQTYAGYGNYAGYYGGYNQNPLMDQTVERLARSFNIQLPACWQNGGNTYGASYTGSTAYSNGYTNYSGASYTGTAGNLTNDFIGRAQCVAKSVRLEDLDLSVSRMIQQGGIFAASQLAQKYPQIAFWINIAAAAVDFILKLTKKTALRLVPTVVQSSEGQRGGYGNASAGGSGYQANYQPAAYSPNPANSFAPANFAQRQPDKISVFAEAAPNDNNFVTAYPVVIHKWQADADPQTINLPAPALLDSCLHAGQNVFKNTDLLTDWMADNFTKDFKLTISSTAGFKKEFPLKKNIGLGGWELNLSPEDLGAFPKNELTFNAVITGKRGFNEIKSPAFLLPAAGDSGWEIESQTQSLNASGDKRIIKLNNNRGGCKCLRAVVFKTASGQQINFEPDSKDRALVFSPNGTEVSLEIENAYFVAGQASLELRTQGGGTLNIPLAAMSGKSFAALSTAPVLPVNSPAAATVVTMPAPASAAAVNAAVTTAAANSAAPVMPNITDLKISRGASRGVITGEHLEVLQYVRINGLKAFIVASENGVKNSAPNQRTVVFENPKAELLTASVSLILGFKNGKTIFYPQQFNVGLKDEKSNKGGE